MKKYLLFCFLVLILAVCGGGGSEPTAEPQSEESEPADAAVIDGPSELQIAVATNDFAVGAPRIPFILFDGTQQVADAQAVQITAFDLSLEPQQAGWTGEATNYSDYEIPYWVAYPEVDKAGNWGLLAEVTMADGSIVQAPFTIQVAEQSQSPAIGSPAPGQRKPDAGNGTGYCQVEFRP